MRVRAASDAAVRQGQAKSERPRPDTVHFYAAVCVKLLIYTGSVSYCTAHKNCDMYLVLECASSITLNGASTEVSEPCSNRRTRGREYSKGREWNER